MSRRSSASFVEVTPEIAEKMARVRDEEERSHLVPDLAVEEIRLLREELEAARSSRDQAIAQVAILKHGAKPIAGSSSSPDGSITLPVTINADQVLLVHDWAQQAGMPLDDFIRQEIGIAMESYWSGV